MREEILAEIKRIAAENNGKPPGSERFKTRTGIRPHEWRGKYWSKWGDALAEAGFSANEWQEKMNLDTAFDGLAEAVRHYRREPSVAEFEMFRASHPDCPSFKSVINRFDSKAELVSSMREWASRTKGFSDLLGYLPAITPLLKKPAIAVAKEGFVYLLKSGVFYKIGRGDELEKRVK